MAAGSSARRTCGWNGCKNPIKANDPRCYLHIHEGQNEPESLESIRARIEARRNGPEFPSYKSRDHGYSIHYVSDKQLHSETLSDHTPVDKNTAKAIVSAVSKLSVDKLETPQEAIGCIESEFPQFVNSLSEHGIARQRISVLTLQGLERRTMRGTPHSSPEAYHEVVVLDRGTDREVVVDPFIAIYAPVRKLDVSVNDQLPSGYTPFGDVPWIGPVDEYVDGHYMQWSNINYQDERA